MIDQKLRVLDPIGWLRKCIKMFGIGRALGRYYGVYRGQVIDNEDEENRGRIRVLVPAIGHIDEADVPSTIYALPTGMTSGLETNPHGIYFTPDVGDFVWVMFEDGLTHLPIYFTGWVNRSAVTSGSNVKGTAVKGFFTKTRHAVELDDESGNILIQRGGSSTMISMSTDGFDDEIVISNNSGTNVYLTTDKATVFAKDGSHVSVGDDNVSMVNSSGSYMSIKGGNITIGASGSIVISAGAKISLKGSVDLGNGPVYEPAVLGTKMAVSWQAHSHVSAGPGNLTVPGSNSVPMTPGTQLSGQVRLS